jgi:hypothetical protein
MFRAADKWLLGYLASVMRRPAPVAGTKHLMFCVADHYEPSRFRGNEHEKPVDSVRKWARQYGETMQDFRDADGRRPQHTFFYPQEEYDQDCVNCLAAMCSGGSGEVEIHLHHRNDTADGLRKKLVEFRSVLRERHGLLGSDLQGNARYGFVHGNWALCNSRPDGDWCGVNEELEILSETGCYADFTFPSAPSPTQPSMVNAIYYAHDTPGKPRGADRGECVSVCRDGKMSNIQLSISNAQVKTRHSVTPLLLITGPLALDWKRRKYGMLPRLENGGISGANPPVPARLDLWVRQHIHVLGRPEWIFVKVHTHGSVAENMNVLLGDPIRKLHGHLHEAYNDGGNWELHYVTAREMYNIVRAAEDGMTGNPRNFRDYEIAPPRYR